MLGLVQVKRAVTRPLVVQGNTPFRIVVIRCDDPRFKFTTPTAANTMHLIPVTFTADAAPGKVSGVIHIETDQSAGRSLNVPAQVQVVPEQPGTN
jgi:hypothetical protein